MKRTRTIKLLNKLISLLALILVIGFFPIKLIDNSTNKNNTCLSPTSSLSYWQNFLVDSLNRDTLLGKLNTVDKDDNLDAIIAAVMQLSLEEINTLAKKTSSLIGTEILYWAGIAKKWQQTDMSKVPNMTDVAQFIGSLKQYGEIDQTALTTYLLFRYNRIKLKVNTNKLLRGNIPFSKLQETFDNTKDNWLYIKETKDLIIALEQLNILEDIKNNALPQLEAHYKFSDTQRATISKIADETKREETIKNTRVENRRDNFKIRNRSEYQLKETIDKIITQFNITSDTAIKLLKNKATRLVDEIEESIEPESTYQQKHQAETIAEMNQLMTRVIYDAELKTFRLLAGIDEVKFSSASGRKNIADKDINLTDAEKTTLLNLNKKTRQKNPTLTTLFIGKTEINYVTVQYSSNDAVGKFLQEKGITDAFNFSAVKNNQQMFFLYVNQDTKDSLDALEHEQREIYFTKELSQIPNFKKALLRVKNLSLSRIAHIFSWGKQIELNMKKGIWKKAQDSDFIKKQLMNMSPTELQNVIDLDRTQHSKLRRTLINKDKKPFFSAEACDLIDEFEQSVKQLATTFKISNDLNNLKENDNLDTIISNITKLSLEDIAILNQQTSNKIGKEVLYWAQMAQKWQQTDMSKVPNMTDVAQFQASLKKYGEIDQEALTTYLLFRYNRINLNVNTNKLSLGDIPFARLQTDYDTTKTNSQHIRETKERIIALEQLGRLTKIKNQTLKAMQNYNGPTQAQREILKQLTAKTEKETTIKKMRESNRQAKFNIRDNAESLIKQEVRKLTSEFGLTSDKAQQILKIKAKQLINEIHESVESGNNYQQPQEEILAENNQFISRVVYDTNRKTFRTLLAFNDVIKINSPHSTTSLIIDEIDNKLVKKINEFSKNNFIFEKFITEFLPIFIQYTNVIDDNAITQKIMMTFQTLKVTDSTTDTLQIIKSYQRYLSQKNHHTAILLSSAA